VFLVSIFDSATAARCPDPLLPVSEGVQWHPATSHTTRQTVAGEVAGCLRSGGAGGVPSSRGEHLVVEPASFGSGSYGGWTATDTAITLSQRDHKGSNTITVEPFTSSQFAQYTEGIGTLRSNGGDLAGGSETLAVYTKSKRPQTATDDETWVANQPNPTLNALDQGDTRTTTVIVGETVKDPVGTLQARVAATNHESIRDGHAIIENVEPVIMRQRESKPGGGKSPLLSNDKSLTLAGGNDQTLFAHNTAVRRLTPLECERLMGWPDNWTEGQADTHRYKQCGNGVASPVATWIAQHLQQLDKDTNATPTQTPTTQIPGTPTPPTPPQQLR
jgi:site-specific DNA-cytosine methylase